ELRNPLTAIQYSLELISASDESSQAAIAVLRRQTRHMIGLVNDLLDVARINRGTLEIQREVIELDQCVLAAVDTARRPADAKGLALRIELPERPIYVHGDPERISQILDNLLSNAIKYTERGSVTITARPDATHALVAVRDTGKGLDPTEVGAVFKAFHQTD